MPLRRSMRAVWYLSRYSSSELISVLPPYLASWCQNYLSPYCAVANLPEPLGIALQRIGRHDERRELAGLVEFEQFGKAAGDVLGRLFLVVADLQPTDFYVLDQQVIRLDRRDLSAGKADHNH